MLQAPPYRPSSEAYTLAHLVSRGSLAAPAMTDSAGRPRCGGQDGGDGARLPAVMAGCSDAMSHRWVLDNVVLSCSACKYVDVDCMLKYIYWGGWSCAWVRIWLAMWLRMDWGGQLSTE
jgi:hypothetical protein